MRLGLRCCLLHLGPPIFLILQQPVNLGNKVHQFLGVLLWSQLACTTRSKVRAFRMAYGTPQRTCLAGAYIT